MPTPLPTPVINGAIPAWANVEFKFNGSIYTMVKSVNYTNAVEGTIVHGTGAEALGETDGVETAEGSVEFYTEEFYRLITDLGDGYQQVRFLGIVSLASGATGKTYTDRLIGCRIKKDDSSRSQGSDADVVKCDLALLKVLRNGLSATKNSIYTRSAD